MVYNNRFLEDTYCPSASCNVVITIYIKWIRVAVGLNIVYTGLVVSTVFAATEDFMAILRVCGTLEDEIPEIYSF